MRMTVINASDAANCHCKITATAMGIVRGHILFGEALLTLERPYSNLLWMYNTSSRDNSSAVSFRTPYFTPGPNAKPDTDNKPTEIILILNPIANPTLNPYLRQNKSRSNGGPPLAYY